MRQNAMPSVHLAHPGDPFMLPRTEEVSSLPMTSREDWTPSVLRIEGPDPALPSQAPTSSEPSLSFSRGPSGRRTARCSRSRARGIRGWSAAPFRTPKKVQAYSLACHIAIPSSKMADDVVRMDKMDQVKSDIGILLADIALARHRLTLSPPAAASPLPKIPPSPGTKSLRSTKSVSRAKKLLRLPSWRLPVVGRKKGWAKLDEEKRMSDHLLRRGSDDSDATLVDDVGQTAADLLAVMAPLVAGLQGLTPQLIALRPLPGEVKQGFEEACEKMLALLRGRRDELIAQSKEGGIRDMSEMEMSILMLDALMRKVEAEQATFKKATNPLALQSQNPFVLHATSISSRGRQSISAPTRIAPVAGGPQRELGGGAFASFASASQSTSWAMNVHRLGSFQASALFSPSPIAVRKLVSGNARA